MTDMVFGTTPQERVGDPILPRWWRTVDKWSLVCILGLFAIGLLLGMAASVPLAERNGLPRFHYVERQAVFGGLGLAIMLVLSMQPVQRIRRIGVLGFVAAMILIFALPVIGTDFGKGATRWLSLGFISIQPSEFLKPGFIIICSWMMAANMEVGGPPGRLYSFVLAMVIAVTLAMQPDFGQATLVIFAWCAMYFISGASLFWLWAVAGLVASGAIFAYGSSEHFARRIDGFLNPEVDPRTQLGYATNAIQEGGFFGVGVGEGSVKWQLPDAHTDFIVAVAAEEYGLIMVIAIILLYAVVVIRSIGRLRRERDPFVRIAASGLAIAFGLQALVNMGVAVRLLPAKGMTLPFVSYGGSSVLASGIAIGMLLALTRTRAQGEFAEIFEKGGK